jgi:hypothetical protein
MRDEDWLEGKDSVTIRVEKEKLTDLMKALDFDQADRMLQFIFERYHKTYVLEGDQLVSNRWIHFQLLQPKRKKSESPPPLGNICPECEKRKVKWDVTGGTYVCPNCGPVGRTKYFVKV